MAKTKNKKSKNTSLDIKYNQLIRKMSVRSFEVAVAECFHKYNNDLIEEVLFYMKNIYYDINKEGCDKYIDTMYFMELLNCIEDYFLLAITGKKYIEKENNFIREQFVNRLKENDIKIELLVYTSKIGFLYENPELYPEDVGTLYADVAKLITDAVYLYSQYITTYICKFKNNEILAFDNDGEHINIKYSPMQNLLKEHIDLMNQILDNNIYGIPISSEKREKYDKYATKITMQIHKAYANFITRDIDSDYHEEFQGHLNFEHIYYLPFYDDNGFIINENELLKIPNNRLYATHSSGIRFEFLDKTHNIDFIDMKENEKHINFNVYIINNGGMSVSWNDDGDSGSKILNKRNPITSKILKISFIVYKENLNNTTNILEKEEAISCLGFLPSTNENNFSMIFFLQLRKILLACIYLAYYNPLLLKKEVMLHNRIIDRKTGYTRNTGFRIAYLKKLPTGHHSSEDALRNAKKEGFDSIPEGYTFVRASHLNPEIEPDKKVIKLDI